MASIHLTDRLKEQTQDQHQALEKQVVSIIKSISTQEDYSQLLTLFYTYFGGLELLVDQVLTRDRMPDYHDRRKTSFLSHDLQVLDATVKPLATGTDLPVITNHLQAIGAMYVMEGSTLGGVHISKMIDQRLPGLIENALTFFNGYGSDTQNMWQKFKMAIDSEVLEPAEEASVIEAANETFLRFGDWIRKR